MRIVRIGDVCEVIAGQSPAGTTYTSSTSSSVEFHQGKKQFLGDLLSVSKIFTTSPMKLAKAGDILMSVRAPVGPTVYLDRDVCIGRGLAAIRARDGVEIRYLYLFLKHIEKSIEGTEGAVFPSINKSQIESLKLPLPSINEQRRIVLKLDAAFEKIDQAITETHKIKKLIKNLEESSINQVFDESRDFRNGSISELTDITTDYVANGSFASLSKNVKYKDTEDYAILLRLLDSSRKFQGPFVYVNKKAYDFLSKSSLEPGDIIISNVGARLGTVFKAPSLDKKMTLGPNSILIKSKQYGDYLYVWLRSSVGQSAIKKLVGGAGQPKFNKTDFRKLIIPVPNNVQSQKSMILKINAIEGNICRLTKLYNNRLSYLKTLKQSMLKQAFSESDVK